MPCAHEHGAECYPDSVSGNVATTSDAAEPTNCTHTEHTGDCGYAPATEGTPCGYECAECAKANTATPSNADPAITVESVQEMIDALPGADEITAENAEEVGAQLTAIDEARAALTDEQTAQAEIQLDYSRYVAAIAALEALAGMAGASTPMLAVTGNYLVLSWDESAKKVTSTSTPIPTDATEITADNPPTTWGEDGKDSYYVVSGEVTVKSNITIQGNVHLILTDNCKLSPWSINVKSPNSLTIYAQSADVNQMGQLNSGCIGAGGSYSSDTCGKITIHGGNITASGDPGIGGTNPEITIYGGQIKATGKNDGAGIGGCYDRSGGTITIYGGEIDAIGNSGGAGIGGGSRGNGGNINIYGGKITATGSECAAGIGGGEQRSGGTITITGGEITATGGTSYGSSAGIGGSAGIAGSNDNDGGTITISGSDTKITAIGNNGNDIGGAGNRGATITIGPEVMVKGKDGTDAVIGATHKASESWTSGEDKHWHPCEVPNCPQNHKYDEADHGWGAGTITSDGDISYTCSTCSYSKTVTLSGISVTTQPTLSYQSGASLDLTGLKITATYSDNSTKEIAYAENSGMTFSIDSTTISNGSALNKTDHDGKTITVTYFSKTANTNKLTVTAAQLTAPQNLQWDGTTAKWGAVANASSYSVQLYKDNGETAIETKTVSAGTSCTFDGLTNPAAGSYTFKVKAISNNANYTDSPESAASGELVFYTVIWQNEGTTIETDVVMSGDTPAYNGTTPTKADDGTYTYTHSGWTPTVAAVTGDVTYKATFTETPREYAVTLNPNSGTIGSGNITGYTYGTAVSLPTNVTRTGYKFGGWYEDSSFGGSAATEISTTDTGNKVFYAKWISTDAGVEAVSVDGEAGTLNGTTITVVLPYGTAALPTDANKVVITPAAGATAAELTMADNGATWTFTVTAEDTTTKKTYTINVSIAADPAAGNKADINAAKSVIQAHSWTVAQTTANTEAAVKTWIEGELSKLNLNGASYTVTMGGTTPATAGSSGDPDGTNGSFSFTVNLSKGEGDAKATGEITISTGIITATAYTPPQPTTYTVSVSVSPTEGGTASASPTTAAQGAEITLTAAPGSGYHFKEWVVVTGNVTINNNKFTMPAGNVTVKAVFEADGGGGSDPHTHTFESGWTSDSTGHWHKATCEHTGEKGGFAAHTPGAAATATTPQTCTVCGYAITPATGGGGGYDDGDDDYTPPAPPPMKQPETSESGGWSEIRAELRSARPGDTIVVKMNGATVVPKEVSREIAGKDVTVIFDMGGSVSWTVNGQDIPQRIADLDLGIKTNSDTIPVSVINAITGEITTMQFELSHSGPFGTILHLTLNVGRENSGYWANLYHLNGKELVFQYASRIDRTGKASWPFDHASSYAVVIDEESHDPDGDKTNPNTGAGNPFTDVKDTDWFYEDVLFVYENGIMLGTSDTTFSPNGTATRGMMATVLWRMEGSPEPSGKNPFTDVPDSEYYADAITWANEQGIFVGYGGGVFGPNDPITREQLATIFYRYAEYKGYDLTPTDSLNRFSDKGEIADWAQYAVKWAVGSGLMFGTTDTTFAPKTTATRAQIAAMIHRFIEKYGLAEGVTATGLTGWIKPDLTLPPQTGDYSNSGLWAGIAMLSAGGGASTIAVCRRKRRKDEDDHLTPA